MIGKLRGKVDSQGEDWVILDVNGVGYLVNCSSRTLATLKTGSEATLLIETHVREDAIRLFGFAVEAERQWFRLLQSVQGVGTKVALAVLGVLSPTDLANAIALQDKAMVTRAPGVGPKVAVRIVTELLDKAPKLSAAGLGGIAGTGEPGAPLPANSAAADAVSALSNLGYASVQASAAIAAVAKREGPNLKTEQLIRLGLKELAK